MRRAPADLLRSRSASDDTNAKWSRFTRALSECLQRLDAEEFLIVESNHSGYVQFCADPDELHAEAMSLQYILSDEVLSTDTRLIAALQSEMGEMGWLLPQSLPPEDLPPEERGKGSPNYTLEWRAPVAFDEAARCAVATLRRVFNAREPDDLAYVAFANAPFAWPSFPELGIPRNAA